MRHFIIKGIALVVGMFFVGNSYADVPIRATVAIGEREYATLAEAIEAIDGEQVIRLIANITLEEEVTLPSTATLDLDIYTITGETTYLSAQNGARLIRNEKAYVCYENGVNNWAVESTYVNFTVTDGEAPSYPDGADDTFIASTASYTRSVGTATWGTICVPFNLKSCGDYTLYNIESIADGVLTLTETEEAVAGTPVIFKNNTGASSITFTTQNATVSKADPVANAQLIGAYTATAITTELTTTYFINGDKFHQAQLSLSVPAYRAYIKVDEPLAAKELTFSVMDDEATASAAVSSATTVAPAACYDLQGIVVMPLQHGIIIANGKKYMKR